MKKRSLLLSTLLPTMTLVLAAEPAHATYVINFAQSGANVVATGSGSLNTSALAVRTTSSLPAYMTGSGKNFLSGSAGTSTVFQTLTSISPFGTGGTVFPATSVGSRVGILSNQYLMVPLNYVSGSDLGTTITTFTNASFSSLGITAGSYVWTWGSGLNADSLTINIGPVQAAVPEPATWAMTILGFGFVGWSLRRRRLPETARVRYDFS